MVTLRDAKYCNLKLLLIFLVTYGHLIEPDIWQSQILMFQYWWIYLFHMPLFTFLSGLFLTNAGACRKQLAKALPLYVLLQTAVVILSNGRIAPWFPCWHLWYLLSFSFWAAVGWIWYRFFKGRGKFLILTISMLIGCAAGLVPFIGREHSLSRTLVFFPYFWLGLLCDPKYPWSRLRPIALLGFGIIITVVLTGGNEIPVTFLYQAEPYNSLKNGIALRLTCYLLGTLLCLFFLSFVPAKRFLFTKIGADTMPAYLIHAPVVLLWREWNLPWPFYPFMTALFLYLIYKIPQWRSKMYGIVSSERGDADDRFSKYIRRVRPTGLPISAIPDRQRGFR